MRKFFILISAIALVMEASAWAQTPESSDVKAEKIVTMEKPVSEESGFQRKWYYGYSFDIRLHNNSKDLDKQNGFSIAIDPEIGYQFSDKLQFGTKLSLDYMNIYQRITLNDKGDQFQDVRMQGPGFSVMPYARYRLFNLFEGVVSIWLDTHLYVGGEFPFYKKDVADVVPASKLTDKQVSWGVQALPLVMLNLKQNKSFNIYFSIMSLGYSGTYLVNKDGSKSVSNDLVLFSGKIGGLLDMHFTNGMYGLKFGMQTYF